MVKIRADWTEEVTASYETTRNGTERVVIETDTGYFVYWFPYKEASDISYTDEEIVLDIWNMQITEAPGEPNESVYDGSSAVTVPKCVVDCAEEVSGYTYIE